MLPLRIDLGEDTSAAKDLGVTHLKDPKLYISSEVDVLLMSQAADAFVKSDHKLAPFHQMRL